MFIVMANGMNSSLPRYPRVRSTEQPSKTIA
jgi:hypothetical protein